MKNISFKLLGFIALLLTFAFVACDSGEPTGFGSLSIELDHVANGETLQLGKDYTNGAGETMNFSMFNYYVSNFKLTKSDGSVYTVPKDSCYFLVKEAANGTNTVLTLKNIPAGNYTRLQYTIGVDSLKSAAPLSQRTGVLDPAAGAAGMYWSWNSGYIFVKVEGTSPQAPLVVASNTRPFRFHIGLFGGKYGDNQGTATLNNLKTVALSSSTAMKVRSDATPAVHVLVDIMEMFKNPTNVSVATNSVVMVTPYAATIADNYKDMFKLDHVHN